MTKAIAEFQTEGDVLLLKLSGSWRLTEERPSVWETLGEHSACQEIRVLPEQLEQWDSSLPLFLMQLRSWCFERGIRLKLEALPEALRKLLQLIEESESKTPPKGPAEPRTNPVSRVAIKALAQMKDSTQFVGECVIGALEAPTDPRQGRWTDLFVEMVQAGPKALPLVSLLSFLVGVVFAFETSNQLRRFGAQIYVINALSVAVVRQIGPILAAVLLAGRTGAAFAAHLGNMKVNGEIDALQVLGVSPINFLVLPRLAALIWMMPMLALYADLFGILGGLFIALFKIHIPATEFWVQVQTTVTFTDIAIGLIKAVVFGVLIGFAGTLRGLQSERSSTGVGRATTSAVVTGIASILVANTLLSPIIDKLGW